MVNRKHMSDEARDENPGPGEQAGEGIGGIGGTLAGAGLGSAAGPIGTILGGIAGAVGGWWAGEKVGRAAEDIGESEPHYREHHREHGDGKVDWDHARIGYGVGHLAGRNPDYARFEQAEPHLRDNWKYDQHDYQAMRPYVREGYRYASVKK